MASRRALALSAALLAILAAAPARARDIVHADHDYGSTWRILNLLAPGTAGEPVRKGDMPGSGLPCGVWFTGGSPLFRCGVPGNAGTAGADFQGPLSSPDSSIVFAAANAIRLRDVTGLSVMGRSGASAGAAQDLTATADGQVLQRAAGALTWGPVPGITGTPNTVTYFNGSGVLSSLTLAPELTLSTGTLSIAALGITTAKLAAGAVTYAKIQNETNGTLLGNGGASPAAPAEVPVLSSLSLSLSGLGLANVPNGTPVLGELLTTGASATSTPASGFGRCRFDATNRNWTCIDSFGIETHGVQSSVGANFITGISPDGHVTRSGVNASQVAGLWPVALTGNGSDLNPASTTLDRLAQNGASTGQVVGWNGTTWVPTTPASAGITALTGGGTATGPGSVPLTLHLDSGSTVLGLLPLGNQAAPTGTGLAGVTSGAWDAAATTVSTGLHRTTGVLTADLSTGVAGGQQAIGGTAAGNDLTLLSTTNATKGRVLDGTWFALDEVNQRLLLGTQTAGVGAPLTIATAVGAGNASIALTRPGDQQIEKDGTGNFYLGTTGAATTGIFTNNTLALSLSSAGALRLYAYTTPGHLQVDSSGNVTADTASYLTSAILDVKNKGSSPLTRQTVINTNSGLSAVNGSGQYNLNVDLSTGLAGGQTAIGGTGASEDLTLSSTTNATKGRIVVGSSVAIDEANGRLLLGTITPGAGTPLTISSASGAANASIALTRAGDQQIEKDGTGNFYLGTTGAATTGIFTNNNLALSLNSAGALRLYAYTTPGLLQVDASGNVTATSVTSGILDVKSKGGAALTRQSVINTNSGLSAANGSGQYNLNVDLSTGIAGGQPVIGGTGASENLTLSSTSNATKGLILAGTGIGLDETNGRIQLGGTMVTGAGTPLMIAATSGLANASIALYKNGDQQIEKDTGGNLWIANTTANSVGISTSNTLAALWDLNGLMKLYAYSPGLLAVDSSHVLYTPTVDAPLAFTVGGHLQLQASGVTATSYTNANITVDAYGRVTAASNGSPALVASMYYTTRLYSLLNGGELVQGGYSLNSNGNPVEYPVSIAASHVTLSCTYQHATITSGNYTLKAARNGVDTGANISFAAGTPAGTYSSTVTVSSPATTDTWGLDVTSVGTANNCDPSTSNCPDMLCSILLTP